MIIDSTPVIEDLTPRWQQVLREGFRQPEALLEHLGLPTSLLDGQQQAHKAFRTRVTRSFANNMERGNPRDPLLLQVLPQLAETQPTPGYTLDPLEEAEATATQGLLHKYPGRVLLITNGACAIHCRYCFRRHFPYQEHSQPQQAWQGVLSHLDAHPDVQEVILSGGDPLMLSDAHLLTFIQALAQYPQMETLRIHTRLPIVLPERVTEAFLSTLKQFPGESVVVVHANHPNEISPAVTEALKRLSSHATLLNQSVLLRDINDDSDTLGRLSRKLLKASTLPYYLHQLDAVFGAAHFQVDDTRARAIHESLIDSLPGYLVPRLVREIPGKPTKTPL